jgi:hypothetical protein
LAGLLLVVTLLHSLAWPTFLGRWKPSELRHIQVITPMLMMLAADGFVRLWRRSVVGRGLVLLLAAHFLLFVFLFQTLLVDVLAVAPPYDRTDIQALRRIEPELSADAVLMSRKPNRAAYYTDRAAVMMPLAGFKDLMGYAQGHNVTHLVVQPRELRTRPGLAEGLAATSSSIPRILEVGAVQIFEVHDYDFLPAIDGDAMLDQEIDLSAPVPPPDWTLLLRRAEPSTWSQTWETWRRWLGERP